MNNQFLSEITYSYLSDTNKPKEKYKDLYEYIIDLRNTVRATNHPLYQELIEESTLSQQKIIYRIFDNQLIEEDFGISAALLVGAGAIVGGIIGLYGDNVLSAAYKGFLGGISSLKQKFLSVEWVKKLRSNVKEHEVVFAMLDEQFSNCSKKCGVDPNKKTSFWEKLTKRTSFNTFDSIDKQDASVHCVITCTLDYLTSSFAELSKVYRVCLEKTGEDLSIANSTGDPLNAIPTGDACQEIREELDIAYKNFKKMIEVLFKDSPQMKSMWINVMNQKIKDALSGKSVKHYSPRNATIDIKSQFVNSEYN